MGVFFTKYWQQLVKLDELEKSALLELQTVSQDSIGQMVKEETEVNNSVSLIDQHLQQLDFLTKNGSNQHVFLLLFERGNMTRVSP
jgi:ABC-type enterochelin transport system substrate-binding protein